MSERDADRADDVIETDDGITDAAEAPDVAADGELADDELVESADNEAELDEALADESDEDRDPDEDTEDGDARDRDPDEDGALPAPGDDVEIDGDAETDGDADAGIDGGEPEGEPDALVSRLRLIGEQPLAERAASLAQLHDELRARLEAGDAAGR